MLAEGLMLELSNQAVYSRQWCKSSRFPVQMPSQEPSEETEVGKESSSAPSHWPLITVLILCGKRCTTFPTCCHAQHVPGTAH